MSRGFRASEGRAIIGKSLGVSAKEFRSNVEDRWSLAMEPTKSDLDAIKKEATYLQQRYPGEYPGADSVRAATDAVAREKAFSALKGLKEVGFALGQAQGASRSLGDPKKVFDGLVEVYKAITQMEGKEKVVKVERGEEKDDNLRDILTRIESAMDLAVEAPTGGQFKIPPQLKVELVGINGALRDRAQLMKQKGKLPPDYGETKDEFFDHFNRGMEDILKKK